MGILSKKPKPKESYTAKKYAAYAKRIDKARRTPKKETIEYRATNIFVEGDTYRLPAFISSTRYKTLAAAKKAVDRYRDKKK